MTILFSKFHNKAIDISSYFYLSYALFTLPIYRYYHLFKKNWEIGTNDYALGIYNAYLYS